MGDGFFSKLKVLVGIEEVEDDDDYLDEEETAPAAPERRSMEVRSGSSYSSQSAVRPEPPVSRENRVVSMQSGGLPAGRITNQFKMVVIEPKGFDESPRLVDNLKARKPVIINLEKLESDAARKIFDFLSGATYALNGNVQKVSNNIFIFAPENVDVTAPAEQKGTGFGEKPKSPWK